MKKKGKIFIAFIVIVAVAVGAYFLLSGKNANAQLHNKVYNYTYNLTNYDDNIVDKVDATISDMLNEISANGLELLEVKSNLEKYLEVKEQYNIVQQQILNYANFASNQNSGKYLKPMNKAYSELVEIYKDGYEYLQKTYFASNFKDLSLATKKTYIENFNVKIENIVKVYNNFMYNAGMAYTTSAKNLINFNNYFKLKMSYYVKLINNSRNLTEETEYLSEEYQSKISSYKTVLLADSVDTYVANNKIYDDLVKNFKALNTVEIVENVMLGTLNTYIEGIKKVETKQYVDNYVTNIING